LISYPPTPNAVCPASVTEVVISSSETISVAQRWLVFGGAIFLVSVPVFFEAPLVRSLPWLSLMATAGWVWLSVILSSKPKTQVWGELLTGFTWTWLAGSLYWGWLRWEPTLHLPIEAIALPIALWGLSRGWCKVGNFFYLGSLFGTIVTDIYFYLADLIPYWRQVMLVEPDMAQTVLRQAVAQVHTPWGLSWIAVLATLLLSVGIISSRSQKLHWLAFSGAVLSTILVDSLFWLAASFA
jgi:hypothetical protein